jgi:thiosulfate/3-mercaptopyruvate sulfurtransferase
MMKSLFMFAALAGHPSLAAAQDALVTTEWVHQNARNPKVRVVEVSVDPGLYEKGHVPGAAGFKWHSELCDPVARDVVSRENFEKLCSRNGISADTTVVLYGDHSNWFACWGFWIFSLYGHKDLKIMDGGRQKWEAEKRPVETTVPSFAAAEYRVPSADAALRVRLADVLEIVNRKREAILVDVRSPDEFTGKIIAPAGSAELAIRAGHIPGARNVPWKQAVREDGTFKPVEELKKLYAAAGIDGGRTVVTYCRIGERSSHSWFALKCLLGYDVRNYDGSWTEWGNAVGVPIENESGTVWTGK